MPSPPAPVHKAEIGSGVKKNCVIARAAPRRNCINQSSGFRLSRSARQTAPQGAFPQAATLISKSCSALRLLTSSAALVAS